MSKLAFILGGGPGSAGPVLPDFAAEDRRDRKRALARSLAKAVRESDDDDELVTAIEDTLAGFKED